MKAILKYNLPEEKEDFDLAMNGSNYMCVIHDLEQHLRAIYKYNGDNYSSEILDFVEKLREKLYEIKSNYNVND